VRDGLSVIAGRDADEAIQAECSAWLDCFAFGSNDAGDLRPGG
jgi:hypothetical protein